MKVPDVIVRRRGAVAGTRSREDVADAAAFQFARSADAVYEIYQRRPKQQKYQAIAEYLQPVTWQ